MKSKRLQEILLGLITLLLVVAVVNPWHLFMPHVLWWGCVVASIIVFGVFATFIWNERASDEREVFNRLFSGRVGFLTGAVAVMVGIMVQSVMEKPVDPWLVVALALMLLGKIIASAYSDEKL